MDFDNHSILRLESHSIYSFIRGWRVPYDIDTEVIGEIGRIVFVRELVSGMVGVPAG